MRAHFARAREPFARARSAMATSSGAGGAGRRKATPEVDARRGIEEVRLQQEEPIQGTQVGLDRGVALVLRGPTATPGLPGAPQVGEADRSRSRTREEGKRQRSEHLGPIEELGEFIQGNPVLKDDFYVPGSYSGGRKPSTSCSASRKHA